MDDLPISETIETTKEIGESPEAIRRRWLLEIKLADKREADWRRKAKKIYELYTPDEPATNSFNILWPNTETLRQAVYNSLPQPQCRRRYSDEDPLGLQVSDVLTRALTFSQDSYDFDAVLQGDVLSMLLAGRAVSRVRYVPDIRTISGQVAGHDEGSEQSIDGEDDSYEEVEWEQAICERVIYDDFRILCAAKKWDDVTAVGFRHRLNRQDCIDKFGDEIGEKIHLDSVDDDDVRSSQQSDLFKTAEVWEIWDKESKQVVFISKGYAKPCKIQDDPLGLSGFFPIPRPLYAIENDQTLIPAALYTQYEQQAKELNRVSNRINKLVDSLRVRGVYDATLSELSDLMKSGDNDLIPSQNVTALIDRGGLDKAIWMLPIHQSAIVLKELSAQREAIKQVIYELTGISDIMRSASNPNETFGAQKLKTQWGSQRLQRMQRETQRYIRDLIRLKAEIIAEKFQPETLATMTLVKLPHQAEVDAQNQQMMMQYQQQAQQAAMQGQQPPPPPQMPKPPITWEAVIQELHDDATRTYSIDIETDSTLSATQDSDMEGLRSVLTGMSEIISGFGPAVQSGAIPIDAVKAIMGVVARRARMGSEVEEALNKIQPPKPQVDPNVAKQQAEAQQQQVQIQHEQQLAQIKMQAEQAKQQATAQANIASEQARMQADNQVAQMQAQMKIQSEQAKLQYQFQLDEAERNHKAQLAQLEQQTSAMSTQMDINLQKWKAELEASTKVMVAQIAAKAGLDQAAISAQTAADNALTKDVDS